MYQVYGRDITKAGGPRLQCAFESFSQAVAYARGLENGYYLATGENNFVAYACELPAVTK